MAVRSRFTAPVTTWLLIINGLIWLGQISPIGSLFTNTMFYAPLFTPFEPWRMLTAGFVHDWSGPIHILFNSYAIYIFGSQLEPMLGKYRYLLLYLLSIVGGSVAVLLLSDPRVPVVGASGAFFGLMGAFFVVLRSLGQNPQQLLLLIAINLGIGFFVSGISWEGHLGGLITGAAIAAVYSQTRKPNQKLAQLLGIAAIIGALVVLTLWGVERIY
jgi:membrane associated rhomboid family serine protease